MERIASHRIELKQGLKHILPVVKTPNILYKRQGHGQISPRTKTLRHLNQVSGKTILTEVIHRSIQPSMTLMCESSTGDHACHLVELGTSHSEGSLISRRIASLILHVLYRGKSLGKSVGS